jgi:hypothetical protein
VLLMGVYLEPPDLRAPREAPGMLGHGYSPVQSKRCNAR